MIPLKDENPTETTPYVTITLLAVNTVIFFYELSHGIGFGRFIFRLGMIPYELTQGVELAPASPIPAALTILSSMFLHGGFFHLGGNMLYLWIFGNNIEDAMGHFRFIIFYLLCGGLAALTHIFVNPLSKVPTVGASGAIAGLLGAYILLYPYAKVRTLIFFFYFIRIISLPAYFVIGFWFIIQLLSGIIGGVGVAWFAHIGGFIAGLLLIKLFVHPQRGSYKFSYRKI
jgi:membrane associated rhomboid family serine protease